MASTPINPQQGTPLEQGPSRARQRPPERHLQPAPSARRRERPSRRPPKPQVVKYTAAVVEELCARMAAGETLPQICRDSHMPNRWTVYNWAQTKPEFLEKFDIAREQLCDYWADEILDISDNSTNDFVLREHGVVLDLENIQRARLRVDSRKWLLSKLAHTKYGDRLLTQTQQLDAQGNSIDPIRQRISAKPPTPSCRR